MRLDKFLKVSRIIKRRTVANEACDNAHVTVNGRPAKASYDVKENDIIEITFGNRTLKICVLNVKEHVLKDEATSLYKVIDWIIFSLSPTYFRLKCVGGFLWMQTR